MVSQQEKRKLAVTSVFPIKIWVKILDSFGFSWCFPEHTHQCVEQLLYGSVLNLEARVLWSSTDKSIHWECVVNRNSRVFDDNSKGWGLIVGQKLKYNFRASILNTDVLFIVYVFIMIHFLISTTWSSFL